MEFYAGQPPSLIAKPGIYVYNRGDALKLWKHEIAQNTNSYTLLG